MAAMPAGSSGCRESAIRFLTVTSSPRCSRPARAILVRGAWSGAVGRCSQALLLDRGSASFVFGPDRGHRQRQQHDRDCRRTSRPGRRLARCAARRSDASRDHSGSGRRCGYRAAACQCRDLLCIARRAWRSPACGSCAGCGQAAKVTVAAVAHDRHRPINLRLPFSSDQGSPKIAVHDAFLSSISGSHRTQAERPKHELVFFGSLAAAGQSVPA